MSYRALKVSPVLLAKDLHMPEGSEIIGAEWCFREGSVTLYVRHPSFPAEPEGCPCQETHLLVTETHRTDGPSVSCSGEFVS